MVITQSFPLSISPYFFFHTHTILGLLSYYVFSLIPFFSGNWHFWSFWLFSHLQLRSFFFPGWQLPAWATAEETGLWCPTEETTTTWRAISYLCSPEFSSRPEDSTALPVSLIILKVVSSCFLTSWLLQSSPQNWDVPQLRGSSFHSPSQGMQGTADWWE